MESSEERTGRPRQRQPRAPVEPQQQPADTSLWWRRGTYRGGTGVQAPPAPVGPRAPRQVTVLQHPEVLLSWSAEFPDKVKVRKALQVWPLRFTLRAEYDRLERSFQYGCSCKDSFLRGTITLDAASHEIHYKKRLSIGGGAGFVLSARCNYSGVLLGTGGLNPVFGFQYEMGDGRALWSRDGFDIRQKLRLSRNLGLEVCGTAQLPLPEAQYAVQEERNTVQVGSGQFHFHVAQVNLKLWL